MALYLGEKRVCPIVKSSIDPNEYPAEWPDIRKILDEDTAPYPGKVIYLYNNLSAGQMGMGTVVNTPSYVGFRTSDDPDMIVLGRKYYTWTGAGDVPTSRGYGVRWVILYYNTDSETVGSQQPYYWWNYYMLAVYFAVQNPLTSFAREWNLEYIFSRTNEFNTILWDNSSLKEIPPINMTGTMTAASYPFQNLKSIKKIEIKSLFENTNDIRSFFGYMCELEEVDGVIDMSKMDFPIILFINCNKLRKVQIYGLRQNLTSLGGCYSILRESLIYLLMNVQDQRESETKIITIGVFNIAKLTATSQGRAALEYAQMMNFTIN